MRNLIDVITVTTRIVTAHSQIQRDLLARTGCKQWHTALSLFRGGAPLQQQESDNRHDELFMVSLQNKLAQESPVELVDSLKHSSFYTEPIS
jgi:hypothetical protein